jgi:site-specific DNA-methyltransferase (adenine-specific)
MKPYYQDDAVTIYHGDSRELTAHMPSVDLTLTDPPYGIGEAYASFEDTPACVRELVAAVIPTCIEKSKRMALTCATRQQGFYPPPSWVLCWLNRAGTGLNPWGFTCWQPILVYGKDPFLEHSKGSRPDVIEHSEASEPNGHPCPKPEQFWKKLLVRCSVLETDLVFDPFMGSGTTLRAAKDLGRKAIGIEIEEKYCEIAARRCAQEVLL